MPCRGPSAEEYAREIQQENDFLTKSLCKVLGFLEQNKIQEFNNYLKSKKGLKLVKWWEGHKEFDVNRMKKAKERLPEALSILNDLPDEELEKVLKQFQSR